MPFLLSTIAGFSTLLGTFLIGLKKNIKIIIISLGFAGGVMFTISMTDLLPEAFNLLGFNLNNVLYIFIMFLIGVLFAYILDLINPIENEVYKVGIVSMLAIILHNIPEGIATFITSSTNIKLGIKLTMAIALHNIPEGITIALPIYYATGSKKRAFIYTLISGMSELLGAVIGMLFISPTFNLGYLYAIIAGIMTYIALFELLPLGIKYDRKLASLSFGVGMLFIIINSIIFH